MFNIFFWTTVCTLLVAQDWSLAASKEKCWKLIKPRLLRPCHYPGSCDQQDANVLPSFSLKDFVSAGNMSALRDCSHSNNLVSVISETLDFGNRLLKNERVNATNDTKRWRNTRDKDSKNLNPKILFNRKQANPDKKQIKLLKDILQIVTFAHYIDSYSRSLERCTENRETEKLLEALEVKLMDVACQMSHILNNTTVMYIETAPVKIPKSLCDAKMKGKAHIDIDTIAKKIVDVLSGLKDAHRCK